MKIHDLITTSDKLADLCERLAKSEFVAVDTEFMRENTYWPELCLVQIADEKKAAAIDPLADGVGAGEINWRTGDRLQLGPGQGQERHRLGHVPGLGQRVRTPIDLRLGEADRLAGLLFQFGFTLLVRLEGRFPVHNFVIGAA